MYKVHEARPDVAQRMALAIGKCVGGKAYLAEVLSSAQGKLEYGMFASSHFLRLGVGKGREGVGQEFLVWIHPGQGYAVVARAGGQCTKGDGSHQACMAVPHFSLVLHISLLFGIYMAQSYNNNL